MKKRILLIILLVLAFAWPAVSWAWGPPTPRVWRDKTAAPTTSDDAADGYRVGDIWIDVTNNKIYQLIVKTSGVADWDCLNAAGSSERLTEGVTQQTFGATDATPDVTNGTSDVVRFWESGATPAITITDFHDSDGDHSDFTAGDWFILEVDDANTTIDFSNNANIEGNANIDFTGSASQILYLLFIYDGSAWNCANFNAGFSDPTTQAISAYKLEGGADALSDDTYTGITIGGLNAGENINQWDVVYLESGNTEYKQADADADEWPARGLAVSSGTDGNELVILVQGTVRNDAWNWSKSGTTLFLSDTPGGITETAPAGAGDCVQIIGWTLSDDEAYFNFSGHYVRKE